MGLSFPITETRYHKTSDSKIKIPVKQKSRWGKEETRSDGSLVRDAEYEKEDTHTREVRDNDRWILRKASSRRQEAYGVRGLPVSGCSGQ
ncbi:hypothetical protein L2E82_40109 [Cichorium intybus]|uniref:Uncharacterized protein n=1 Tax=Cichorium intybus TaxID=13427 RepID=A0ACB9AK36_CICIN|nr:hypothetical protein L2E82_40109 [Cichorium intybus]